MRKSPGYWTKENCATEALKYTARSKFQKKSSVAYNNALKNKWLDELCNHMIIKGNRYKRCIYAIEFNDNHVYIGLSYDAEVRFDDHKKIKSNRKKSSVYKYIEETGLIPILNQLTDYMDVNLASKLEGIKRNEYENNGWIILNKAKCGGVGSGYLKRTKEKCYELSIECKSKAEFKRKNNHAYKCNINLYT